MEMTIVGVLKYDKDSVLDLWEDGATAKEIAEIMDMPYRQTALVIIQRARVSGDPRAHRRYKLNDACLDLEVG